MALVVATVIGAWGCAGSPSPSPTPTIPTITTISPSSVTADGAAFTLTITGTNFVATSTVNFGGAAPATTFVSSTQLTAAIPASSITSTGTLAVSVTNPAPGGGTSNPAIFFVTNGGANFVPTISGLAVDPTGKFAYVASEGCCGDGGGSGFVSMYTINPTTGALTSIGPAVFPNDEFTDSVAVDPFGKFAYVVSPGDVFDDQGSIVTYAINPATGALTSTTGGIFANGISGDPEFFNSVAIVPSGKFAYAADGGGFPPGTFDGGMGTSNVSMYTIDSTTGALTSIGVIAAGTGPDSVAVDPAGKFAYVSNFGSNNVSMYSIDATTGALTSMGTIAAGTGPISVAVDPAGKFAYVTNFASNDVSMYSIDATTGALASIGTISAGTDPVSVAVDPAGKFAYVTNSASNNVSMYSINAMTGALTSIGTIDAGSDPTCIAIHPSGKFAYVANSGINDFSISSIDVSIYSIDPATGALTLIGTIGT